MVRRVNDEDQQALANLAQALQVGNPAIVTTTLDDGTEIAVVAHMSEDADGMANMYPLAILVTDDIFNRINRPDDDL